MKAIICGAGRVGHGIAGHLAGENNDVTVIDQSPELIHQLQDSLDVRGIVGHGAHPEVLDRAGASDADMIIAVTYSDEVNMIAAQVAHSLFAVPLKIARVRAQSYLKPEWQDLFSRENMPIDVIISPELEVGKTVLRRLANPGAFETVDFVDGRVQVVGVTVEENSAVVNTPLSQLSELFPDLTTVVAGIWRDGALFVPRSSDQMMAGDEIYFIAAREHVVRTLDIFGHEEREARRIIIVGGGNIGLFTAKELEQHQPGVKVRLIERDKERAERAADELERIVVLHGDGLDQSMLREAGVRQAETLIALTNNDEVNIITSMIAKRMGCKRVMALVNNPEYTAMLQSLDIDTFLDPRATTISTILQHVRRGRIKGLHSIRAGAAEVIEAEALETSPLVGRPLREAKLPDGLIVGAIVRGQEVVPARGDTEIMAKDRVVIFAERTMVKRVEQMFRVSLDYF
jgi:trk system potassium uptake protein TrkA